GGSCRYSMISTSTSRSSSRSSVPRELLHAGLWYTVISAIGARLPWGNNRWGSGGEMATTQQDFKALGRDDANSIESILADDEIDFGEFAHATAVGGDAIFTW